MIRTAITTALVPQARQGPFVFHDDLPGSIRTASALGFDAVEIFPPSADALDVSDILRMTADAGLKVAAVGTGAGFVVHKLSLTDADAAIRSRATDFIKAIIDVAAVLNAPAIIGSMQGRHDGNRAAVLDHLAAALATLATHRRPDGPPLLYEPLNRYETNLFTRQGDAATFLRERNLAGAGVKILADLFHMNIEEPDLAAALRDIGPDLLGHVHFVDSNRQAPGQGHTDFAPVVAALRELNYTGYASAECFPIPDAETAAKQTIETYNGLFRN
jgi:sugar phosphate isomerase/epimerase